MAEQNSKKEKKFYIVQASQLTSAAVTLKWGAGILRRESGSLVILCLFLHVPVIEDWVIQASFLSEKNFSKLYKIV